MKLGHTCGALEEWTTEASQEDIEELNRLARIYPEISVQVVYGEYVTETLDNGSSHPQASARLRGIDSVMREEMDQEPWNLSVLPSHSAATCSINQAKRTVINLKQSTGNATTAFVTTSHHPSSP